MISRRIAWRSSRCVSSRSPVLLSCRCRHHDRASARRTRNASVCMGGSLSGQTGRKPTRTRQEHPQGFLQTVPKQEGIFRNGASHCQGFQASQKFQRRTHSFTGFKTQKQKLTFTFLLQPHFRTEDSPSPGFVLPSVVSINAATLCLVQIWSWVPIFHAHSTVVDSQFPYGISRNLVPKRDLCVPVVSRSLSLRYESSLNRYA